VLFAGAFGMLAAVPRNQRNLLLAGVPFITAIGGLFTPAATLAAAQHVALILGQPLIPGAVLLVVLKLVLRPPAT
jgi:hypothetical protein